MLSSLLQHKNIDIITLMLHNKLPHKLKEDRALIDKVCNDDT